jgi:hypothetical protein
MFMHAILPQERLQVLIDKPADAIDILDGRALWSRFLSVEGHAWLDRA